MLFQVPQFIEMENKIVGPMTLRQFSYIGVAFVLTIIFFSVLKFSIAIILSIIAFVLATALAFLKINNRSFASYVLSILIFAFKPQLYVWKPLPSEKKKEEQEPTEKPEEIKGKISAKKLHDIATKLDIGEK